ncbi:YqaJ viral recombinase family protein [Enterobacteriaceae bacterium YMB-R22]|uniref:lambda exonuclease family protein n=1 Tax=Tenebrionicola larvae TaxID=2815733 RepID=UPI00201312F0|nr:lambda exonuclease family protein [Tenebrionicola larvae]MBV4411834.1 YqaJ viral recombinase family protein [Tenebrionicola larvae]
MQQRSDEWFAARCGKVTASRLGNVMSKTKSGYAASRQKYMAELICQRLTGRVEEIYSNVAMQRGIDLEPVAHEMYALNEFDANVVEVGLIDPPNIPNFAASPDGLINDDGLLEIKCPNTWTHLETLRTGQPKRIYLLQMHGQMMCTGRKWCDFVSYDDRLPPDIAYFKTRVQFDEALAREIEAEVTKFLDELNTKVNQIIIRGGGRDRLHRQ